jgi:hypothetical protein
VGFWDAQKSLRTKKIKVRGEKREMMMVLFATMAANAVKIAKKRNREEPAHREKAA